MKGERLDNYLYAQGLAQSRERARALVMAGIVYVNNEKAEKAGTPVPVGANVEVRGATLAYVSRGGLKLEKALQTFKLGLRGLVCMDVGASTGGFTDCMLQNGAAKVYAVDVGYGQLAWKLRCDTRVINMERTNIRHLQAAQVGERLDFFSVDVAFISLKHVFPAMAQFVKPGGQGVCLVKPQFEAGREKVGKKGVVRSADTHAEVIENAQQYALQNGFAPLALSYSPITGPQGNIEFLLLVRQGGAGQPLSQGDIIDTVQAAHKGLAEGEET